LSLNTKAVPHEQASDDDVEVSVEPRRYEVVMPADEAEGFQPSDPSVCTPEQMLRSMPDGVVVLDADNKIVWANQRLSDWTKQASLAGHGFYAALQGPEILGPDMCPFNTARASGRPSSSTLHSGDSFFRVHAAPLGVGGGPGGCRGCYCICCGGWCRRQGARSHPRVGR